MRSAVYTGLRVTAAQTLSVHVEIFSGESSLDTYFGQMGWVAGTLWASRASETRGSGHQKMDQRKIGFFVWGLFCRATGARGWVRLNPADPPPPKKKDVHSAASLVRGSCSGSVDRWSTEGATSGVAEEATKARIWGGKTVRGFSIKAK